MSATGLLNGHCELELFPGSKLTIESFRSRRDGLPSGPTLRSKGTAMWTTELEGEGLPTSPHLTQDAVDFFAAELGGGSVIVVAADRFAFALRTSDGKVISRVATRFTGRNSLDSFFFASPSSDEKRFVIASTKRITVFASSGKVLADEDVPGLVTACSWVSPSSVAYEWQDLDREETTLESRFLHT